MRAAALAVALVAACGGGGDGKAQKRGSATVDFVDHPMPATPGSAGSAAPTGATTDEVEPDDAEDVASVLAPGASVRGTIGSDTDVDFFRIDVTRAGVLALDLTEIEGFDLTLELEDASGTVLAKSDRGGVRVREGIPNFGVAPGRYLAVVRAKHPDPPKPKPPKKGQKVVPVPPPSSAGPSPVYTLSASVAVGAPGAEREPDEDRGTANELILGDLATGYVGWTGDVDTYKLSLETMSAKNAIDVELSAVEGVALTLEVASGIGVPIVTRKGARHGGVVVRGFVPAIPQDAPPFLYLTVKGDRSNPETAYQLKAVEHAIGPDAEREPDDTIDKPMAIPADRTFVKATWSAGDVDCFALAPSPDARTVEIAIGTPDVVDFTADLLVDGKSIATSNAPGKGTPEKLVGAVPPNATAIVRVRATDAGAGGEGAYTVTVSESAAAP